MKLWRAGCSRSVISLKFLNPDHGDRPMGDDRITELGKSDLYRRTRPNNGYQLTKLL
jgi:hypothetical protein